MSIQKLEAELEATRQKIAKQLSMVGRSIQSIDPTLYDKEEVLEQAIAMWRVEFDHEPSHSAREHWNANKEAASLVSAWSSEIEKQDKQKLVDAPVTLQDLLTEYKEES